MRSILLDWFDNGTHSKINVGFCSITELNRTIGVRLGSIEFWFDFVRLDTPGVCKVDYSPLLQLSTKEEAKALASLQFFSLLLFPR